MRWSEIYLKTLKEKPAQAETPGHVLLLRGAYIHALSAGIFTYNSLFLKSIKKLNKIVREELEKQGAREVLMPMVQPKDLWMETGRWQKFSEILMKMKNKQEQEFCLGPTHEEVITSFLRSGLTSHRDMPLNLYQIQTKYRDEIRPRFGLIRAREFIMKDAYSMDTTEAKAMESYNKMFQAYSSIFRRLNLDFTVVQADTGGIGGKKSEEFHLLAERGEDVLLVSDKSDFSANREICPSLPTSSHKKEKELEKEKFPTPKVRTIEELARLLKCQPDSLVKTLFVRVSLQEGKYKYVAFLCKGDDEINLCKLAKELAGPVSLCTSEEVKNLTGASPGSCGPVGLDIPVYVDHKLKGKCNFVVGANETGHHYKQVNFKDFKLEAFGDFCLAKQGDPSPDGKGTLKEQRGIEVGHLFFLSNLYSKAMGLTYQDEQGKQLPVEMGCYGLGITRTLQACIEQNHDKDGIVWPLSLAPFLVHICLLQPESEEVLKFLTSLETQLKQAGIEYFIDDRKERPGVKFKDADLLGMPFRLNLGERDLKENRVELVVRKTRAKSQIQTEDVCAQLKKLISDG